MKRLVLFSLTLLSVFLLNAQSKIQSNEELYNLINGGLSNEDFFNKSELVVEGKFIKVVDTYDAVGNDYWDDFYTILSIKVQRVYKGDQSLTGDTVYTVCKKSMLGMFFCYYPIKTEQNVWVDVRHTIPSVLHQNGILGGVSLDTPSVFFLVTSDLPDTKNPKSSSYKKYKFLHQSEESKLWILKNNISELTKILELNNLVFDNRNEFYDYMRQFEGYTVPESVPLPEKKEVTINIPELDTATKEYILKIQDSIWDEIYKDNPPIKKNCSKGHKNNCNGKS